MIQQNKEIQIVDVSPDNVAEVGIYCIKDKKSPGYRAKVEWFKSKMNEGLKLKIAIDNSGKQLGFIEYIPSELAWRPIQADNYYFIHCIAMFVTEARDKGVASTLIALCAQDAKENKRSGICAMSSEGPWIANKSLFEKNNFSIVDQSDRFELMAQPFDDTRALPRFFDWTNEQHKYTGWNLIYADQCPWHEKSVADLRQSALDHGILLNVKKLETPREAQNAPSGFGTFSLIKDGKLLADHYISKTRFENILKQQAHK